MPSTPRLTALSHVLTSSSSHQSFISDTVNGGVYVLSPEFFSAPLRRTPSKSNFYDYVLESEYCALSVVAAIHPLSDSPLVTLT